RVYAECYKDLQYGGASTSINMAVDLCGGIDIFKDLNSSGTIDSENVIANNPQVILKQTSSSFIPLCGYDATNSTRMEMAAKVESIMNRTGWDHIDAVKNKRVYIITSDAASIHPSIFYSYVAKWLHPELFKDMNPVAIHKEWLQKFLEVDFKGVYACPLLEEC
ncbi:MAG: ABC transporter substrate-binding protein, partial [Methanothrix sp.]|nr:ABC transporter substrate-binding protein [Methanothrix sp.]